MDAAEPIRSLRRTHQPTAAAPAAAGAFAERLRAAQAGGEWALASLYRAHDPAIRRFLRGHVGQDADDLASQTWIDAARNLHRFEGDEDAFRGWLFTIARRRMIDRTRRRARRPEELTDLAALDVADRCDPAEDATAALSGDDAARLVAELLPPDQAEIVLLRVVGGLDVATVAEITGKRPGTVRVAQHRALRRLARALGADR